MLPVQRNIPMPKALRTAPAPRRKYPFEDMKVGDMFFVPNKTKNTLATHASTVGKALDRKFVTRLAYMAATKRGGWDQATHETPGAVLGVGVWRVR